MSYIRNIEPILIRKIIGNSKRMGVESLWKCGQSFPLFQHLAKLLGLQTPGMQERKKEMSWMHVLSVLWGAGNLSTADFGMIALCCAFSHEQ